MNYAKNYEKNLNSHKLQPFTRNKTGREKNGTPDWLLATIIDSAIYNKGGITIDLSGYQPDKGYAVNVGRGGVVLSKQNCDQSTICQFIIDNKRILSQPDTYIGGWKDGDNVYLDIIDIYNHARYAKIAGLRAGERTIYDLSSNEVIYL